MEVAVAAEVPTDQGSKSLRSGVTPRQWLLSDEAADGFSFRVFRSHYQGGDDAFQSPRHHHAFQQIRWTESGAVNFGPGQYIQPGEIAYFPRGAYYGPQLKDHGIGILIQFGFGPEMVGGKYAIKVHREGIEKLRARGRIEGGDFIDVDPITGGERRRDAAEVIAQEHTKTQFTIRAAGYDSAILMHPNAYSYYEAAPGLFIKHLGGFFDQVGPQGDVRISVLRLSKGAEYALSDGRAQVLWSTGPGMRIKDRICPELTFGYSPRGESTTITSEEPNGVEIYLVEFPRLD